MKKNIKIEYDILLINPPANIIETPDIGTLWGNLEHTFTTDNILVHAINHGILSIATYCDLNGYRVNILDMSNDKNFNRLKKMLSETQNTIIGVSSQSGYDYMETLECIRIIKKRAPSSITIAGGQHIGMIGEKVFDDTDDLDILCTGEGERAIIELLKNPLKYSIPGIIYKRNGILHRNTSHNVPVNLDMISPLNYSLYPNVRSYTPIVEESRGCPYNCRFCTNRRIHPEGIRIKSYKKIYIELLKAMDIWGKDVLYVFSAANFGLDIHNTLELMKLIKPLGIKWTCELRADSKICDYLDIMYDSGLTLLAIGLESVDTKTLKIMNKTNRPMKYIEQSITILNNAINKEKLSIRLNIILYIGIDRDVIRGLLEYLIQHFKKYDAIYVTPVYFNPGTEIYENIEKYKDLYKVKMIKTDYWVKRHLFFCNPSQHYSFTELINFSSMLEKIFKTEKGWETTESIHFALDSNKINKERIKK